MRRILQRSTRLLAATVGLAGLAVMTRQERMPMVARADDVTAFDAFWTAKGGAMREDLPFVTGEELAAHDGHGGDGRIWCAYKNGVYDITEWVLLHPGGEKKIRLAGGKSLEQFWPLYQQHMAGWVLEILESYRIANIASDQLAKVKASDPYKDEPDRDPRLVVHNPRPFNAEPPSELLVDEFLTPNELFYVRNHYPVPQVDTKEFRLRVAKENVPAKSYSVADIMSTFVAKSVIAVVQCGGNRRSDLDDFRPVKGGMWNQCAIGNAEWRGAPLRDVLRDAGVPWTPNQAKVEGLNHIHFAGLDADEAGEPYQVSVPVSVALAEHTNAVLAYEMNGQPLPPDHGAPLRIIVPGLVGARQVKWLADISLEKDENQSQWQQRDYKAFSPSTDWDHLDWSSAPPMHAMPVQSAICWPPANADVDATTLPTGARVLPNVRGYAHSGGGSAVTRVDVSADAGATWHTATLEPLPKGSAVGDRNTFGWRRWRVDVPLPESESVTLHVKATDENYNTQPETSASIWNMRGLASNAWHKVEIHAGGEMDTKKSTSI